MQKLLVKMSDFNQFPIASIEIVDGSIAVSDLLFTTKINILAQFSAALLDLCWTVMTNNCQQISQ
jgi:hypothetical protein